MMTNSIVYRIYCGRTIGDTIGDSGYVDDLKKAMFLDIINARYLGLCFSIFDSVGRWCGDGGTAISEDSFVIELVQDQSATSSSVEPIPAIWIAREYKERFNQECVLVTSHEANMMLV